MKERRNSYAPFVQMKLLHLASNDAIINLQSFEERKLTRLNIDIPDTTHQQLRICAAQDGITIKDLVLECVAARLTTKVPARDKLEAAMDAWEQKRKSFYLERGNQRFHEIAHEGHRW